MRSSGQIRESLFGGEPEPRQEDLAPGATLLRGFVAPEGLRSCRLYGKSAASAIRHMITPGGFRMSVAMTNCGALGWVTDRTGYRYDPRDPANGLPCRAAAAFAELAAKAASQARFGGFVPDACLVNRYAAGARMSLHQDRRTDQRIRFGILMQRHPGARRIAVDQAASGTNPPKRAWDAAFAASSAKAGGSAGQAVHSLDLGIVTVSRPIRHPAQRTAVVIATDMRSRRGDHVTKWRLLHDFP